MSALPINLNNCDLEPIHLLGKIQPHGFLIIVDQNGLVQFFSANANNFIGKDIGTLLLGKSLDEVENLFTLNVPAGYFSALIRNAKSGNFDDINPVKIKLGEDDTHVILSSSSNYYLLEFEPMASTKYASINKKLSHAIPQLLAEKNLLKLLESTAAEVSGIIGYDRVMVYRFAKNGHGEVIAEVKNDDLESFLGLHYPASDIPKQARVLYKISLTRLINDVDSIAADLITDAKNDTPLDLSFSQLRAVSPIHIQYLKNMGVVSSFSVSILCNDELWGLIACHNYTPKFIDFESRESAKLVGQVLSAAITFRQEEADQQQSHRFHLNFDKLSKYLQGNNSIEDALTTHLENIMQVVNASGAVLCYEDKLVTLGVTPKDVELHGLTKWLSEEKNNGHFYCSSLSAEYTAGEAFKNVGAGILSITLSKELKEYVIWFKPEILQEVKWAGNPDKTVTVSGNNVLTLEPRQSFAAWVEQVSGTSEFWSVDEIKSALRLKEEILSVLHVKAGAIRIMNEKLKYAYKELDTFSLTVSHDLKTPITAIKSYSQLLELEPEITSENKRILQRIGDRADKMNLMINAVLEYSRISRHTLQYNYINTAIIITEIIEDLNLVYSAYKVKVDVGETPALQGDAVMLGQIFNNLIGNAVKYSQHSISPLVQIEGKISGTQVLYTIKDNGIGIAQNNLDNIFLLFSRMENAKHFEGTGIGLAIVKKIIEKHNGRIWAESELGKGTTFFLLFNRK